MYPSCDYTEKIKVNAENGFHLALLWFEFQIETSALSHQHTAQAQHSVRFLLLLTKYKLVTLFVQGTRQRQR